jgi:hypothetical protein
MALDELQERLANGQVVADELIWWPSLSGWIPASDAACQLGLEFKSSLGIPDAVSPDSRRLEKTTGLDQATDDLDEQIIAKAYQLFKLGCYIFVGAIIGSFGGPIGVVLGMVCAFLRALSVIYGIDLRKMIS